MKRQLALITCLLLLPTSVIAAPPITNINTEQKIAQNNSEQLQQQAKAITVKITSDDNGGSGVLIAQRQQTYLVLTNAHVTKNGKNFRIKTPDGEIHPASLVSDVNFPNHDLALLQFSSNKQYTIAKLNKLAPHPDTTILAAGFDGETGQLIYSNGKITQVPSPGLVQGYQIGYTSKIVQGMSGGPILDEKGELIGINGRSAYPILNTGYVYSDGTNPTPEQIQQLRSVSWGIPIATFLAQVPQATAIAYSLPQPQIEIGWLGQLNQQAKQITVRIDNKDNPNDKGSGIIIAKQNNTYYVLTCEHVVSVVIDQNTKNLKNNEIITPDGKTYPVDNSKVKTESGVDLAVVQFTSNENYPVATIGDARIADYQYLFVGGYSKLRKQPSEWRFSVGNTFSREQGLLLVKSDVVDGNNAAALQSASSLTEGYELVYTNLTYGGMSGGPVLDTQGRVIGIHGKIEGEVASDEKAGEFDEVQLGYSLGIPVRTFLGLAERLNVNPQWLKVQDTLPSQLDAVQKDDVKQAVLTVGVPKGNAKASKWIERGNQLWRLGRYEEAIAAFDEAIKRKPAFVYLAWYGKGLVLMDQKKYESAANAFEQAISNQPNFARMALKEQSIALRDSKQLEPALAAIEKAIHLQPNDANLYLEKGYNLGELKRYPEGIAAYTQGIQLSPRAAFYNNRGILYGDQKKWDLALADYNTAIKLSPELADAYNNRGSLYKNQKKWDLALADFNTALQLNPESAKVYNNRGNLYKNQKKWDLALADYNTALKLNPELAPAYTNRGNVYYNQKKWDLALADYIYTEGETEKAFQLADTALRSDKRLANLAYLKDNLLQKNLWGDRLLSDTQKFYTTPRMQALLSQMQGLSGGENK